MRAAHVIVEARVLTPPKLQGDVYEVAVTGVLKGKGLPQKIRLRATEKNPWVEKPAPAWEARSKRVLLYLLRPRTKEPDIYRTYQVTDLDRDFALGTPAQQKRIVQSLRSGIRFFAQLQAQDADAKAAVRLWDEGLRSENEDLVLRLLGRLSLERYFDASTKLVELVKLQRSAGLAPLMSTALLLCEHEDAPVRASALGAVHALVLETASAKHRKVARQAALTALDDGPEGVQIPALEVLAALSDPLALKTAVRWLKSGAEARVGAALRAVVDLSARQKLNLRPAVRPLVALLEDPQQAGAARRALEAVVGNAGLTLDEWRGWWKRNAHRYPQ